MAAGAHDSERSILWRVARGEPEAVREAVEAFGPLVWRIARARLDPPEAEELVQDVFADLWRSAARHDPRRGSEATFVSLAVRRRLAERARLADRARPAASAGAAPPEAADSTGAAALGREVGRAREALNRLAPDERRVLRLSLAAGLTPQAIAAAAGLPLGTVRSGARRGLQRIRELLRHETMQGEAT